MMDHLIYLVQVILVIFVISCDSRSYKKDSYDCSSAEQNTGECESDNEVINDSSRQEADDSEEQGKKSIEHPLQEQNLTSWEAVRDFTDNQEVVVYTTESVTAEATVENVTCKYRFNMSGEEDEETSSTLVDYPYSVSIQKKGAHYVTGALVDKRWILSVAGEFFNVRESLKLFRARLGSVDCKRGGTLVPIKKIEIHPYYIHGKPNFDVALLRMALPVEYSNVLRPIGISNIRGKVLSAKFLTTYWPRIVVKGQTLPETAKERIKYNSMRVSTQRLIQTDKCTKIMTAINESMNESSLCLKPVVTHHSICMPDAGAPVVAEDGLWGITSGWVSPTCPSYAAPTIFTRLSSSSVSSWLDTHLRNH